MTNGVRQIVWPWVPGAKGPRVPGPWVPGAQTLTLRRHLYTFKFIHCLYSQNPTFRRAVRKHFYTHRLILTDTNMGHIFLEHHTYNTRKPLVGKISSPCEMFGSHRRMGPTYTMIMLTVHDGYDGTNIFSSFIDKYLTLHVNKSPVPNSRVGDRNFWVYFGLNKTQKNIWRC